MEVFQGKCPMYSSSFHSTLFLIELSQVTALSSLSLYEIFEDETIIYSNCSYNSVISLNTHFKMNEKKDHFSNVPNYFIA